MEAGLRASWDGVREGLADGAAASGIPRWSRRHCQICSSTARPPRSSRGVPAVGGLRTALACVAAQRTSSADRWL